MATASAVAPSRSSPQSGRVPKTLQSVFLASNRGNDVHKPPPQRVAHKMFLRSWMFGKRKQKKGHVDSATPACAEKESKMLPGQSCRVVPQKAPTPPAVLSPNIYLDGILRERGYSTKVFESLECAYSNKPSEYQKASYHIYLVDFIRNNNMKDFRNIMNAGISLNPCNAFGESLIHTVCRRGHKEALEIMLEAGSSLQTCDDFGRTPLHDACWASEPHFDVVEMILAQDMDLLRMADCRGAHPLSYVRKEHWNAWIVFLDSKKDVYFPQRDPFVEQNDPPLCKFRPNTHPLPVPNNALTVELASMVASGRMKPTEASLLSYASDDNMDEDSFSEEDEDDDDYSSSEESYISESEFLLDENEMEDILRCLSAPVMKPVAWSSAL